jgi:hypothetical protein
LNDDSKGENMMTRLAIFANLLIWSIVPQLTAAECSNADLRGDYSFVVSGTIVSVPGLPSGPFAAAGKGTYEGNGNVSGAIQISLSGTMLSSAWHGTYIVNPSDCTVTKAVTLDVNGATLHFFITAGDDFKELRFIATDTGTALTGTARKQ